MKSTISVVALATLLLLATALTAAAMRLPDVAAGLSSAKTLNATTSVVTIDTTMSYLYVHADIAVLCPYTAGTNYMAVVNLTSQTSMPKIPFTAPITTDNHMCYLEVGVGKKTPLQVYQFSDSEGVVAYSVATQSKVWSNMDAGTAGYGPSFNKHRDEVYVTNNGKVFCIDASTGLTKWNISASNGANFKFRPTLMGSSTILVMTDDSTLIAYDVSSGQPSGHLWRMKDTHVYQADRLEIIEGGFGNGYMRVAPAQGDSSSASIVKFDYTMGTVGWTTKLHSQSALTGDSWVNTITFCLGDFEVWAVYNGTNIARIGRNGGSVRSVTPFPDGHTTSQGIVNLGKNFIASVLGSAQTLYGFTDLDGSFAGKMVVPPSTGSRIRNTVNWVDAKGDTNIIANSNAPAVVTIGKTGN